MLQIREGLVVPGFVLGQPDLNPGAKLVFSILCHVAEEAGQDHCSPNQKSLAAWIGQSRRSVQNHLSELAKAGFIQVSPGEQTKAATYRILMWPVGQPQQRQEFRLPRRQSRGDETSWHREAGFEAMGMIWIRKSETAARERSAGRGGPALMSQPLFNFVHGELPLA